MAATTCPPSLFAELASSFESAAILAEKHGDIGNDFGAVDLYRAGLALSDSRKRAIEDGAVLRRGYEALAVTYRGVVSSIPTKHLSKLILGRINAAFSSLVGGTSKGCDENGVLDGALALCGLYVHSTEACRAGFEIGLCASLAELYDREVVSGNNKDNNDLTEFILETLSVLLLHGLILAQAQTAGGDGEDDSSLSSVMEVVHSLTSDTGANNPCLGDLQKWQERRAAGGVTLVPFAHAAAEALMDAKTLKGAVKDAFPETPQREYLLLMLQSCPTADSLKIANSIKERGISDEQKPHSEKKKGKGSVGSPPSALDRLIAQVREVLPHLGEGYVEVALACYGNDASHTLTALLEAKSDPTSLHPRLGVLDQTLPRRRREGDGAARAEEEARQVQKARVKEMERRSENEAYMLGRGLAVDEYNDDYDDQYDAVATGDGVADSGMYDVDIDAVKTYNRIAREQESDQVFWVSADIYFCVAVCNEEEVRRPDVLFIALCSASRRITATLTVNLERSTRKNPSNLQMITRVRAVTVVMKIVTAEKGNSEDQIRVRAAASLGLTANTFP